MLGVVLAARMGATEQRPAGHCWAAGGSHVLGTLPLVPLRPLVPACKARGWEKGLAEASLPTGDLCFHHRDRGAMLFSYPT